MVDRLNCDPSVMRQELSISKTASVVSRRIVNKVTHLFAWIESQSLHTMLFACDEGEALGGEAAQEPTRDGRQVTG